MDQNQFSTQENINPFNDPRLKNFLLSQEWHKDRDDCYFANTKDTLDYAQQIVIYPNRMKFVDKTCINSEVMCDVEDDIRINDLFNLVRDLYVVQNIERNNRQISILLDHIINYEKQSKETN